MRIYTILSLSLLATLGSNASADGWGNLKGQVVLDDKVKLKPIVKLDVTKDQAHCLAKGNLLPEQWVVHPTTKGIKWVMVWVAVEKEGKADHLAEMPIHAAVKAIKNNMVVVDQPCCRFEPHVLGIRKGQDFVGKNSSPIPHNMAITGFKGPNVNQVLPPGGAMTIAADKWSPWYIPVNIACGIHPWMNAKIFCFNHPYFVVTDDEGKFEIKNVPAGKLRLIVWHEGMGWVVKDGEKGSDGKGITVEANKTLELGKLPVKVEE